MVLFHLSFKADGTETNTFRVDLNHDIPMQPLKYCKSVVRATYAAAGPPAALTNTVIYARVPWLSHYEVTNSQGESLLPVAFQPQPTDPNETSTYTSERYDITLKADDIPRSFDVSFFQDDAVTPMNFKTGVNNTLQSVDLYFEFAHNDAFH